MRPSYVPLCIATITSEVIDAAAMLADDCADL
jgi:hypothetical protein